MKIEYKSMVHRFDEQSKTPFMLFYRAKQKIQPFWSLVMHDTIWMQMQNYSVVNMIYTVENGDHED